MPPLPAVPNVLVVSTKFTVGSDTNVQTRWHFQYTGGPPSNADCTAMAATILGDANTDLASDVHLTSTIAGVEVYDLSSATAGAGSSSGSTVGSKGGTPLPANTCCLCNATISRRYRGGKPRTFWPFGGGADIGTAQTWTTTSQSQMQTGLNNYRTHILAVSHGSTVIASHVNVSYYSGFTVITDPVTGRVRMVPKLRTGGPLVDQITGISVNPKPGTQRRRINA
jgi:hypothetical protein